MSSGWWSQTGLKPGTGGKPSSRRQSRNGYARMPVTSERRGGKAGLRCARGAAGVPPPADHAVLAELRERPAGLVLEDAPVLVDELRMVGRDVRDLLRVVPPVVEALAATLAVRDEEPLVVAREDVVVVAGREVRPCGGLLAVEDDREVLAAHHPRGARTHERERGSRDVVRGG